MKAFKPTRINGIYKKMKPAGIHWLKPIRCRPSGSDFFYTFHFNIFRRQTSNLMTIYKNLTYFIILFFLPFLTSGQTYTGGGGTIPDDGNSIDFTLNVGFLNPSTIDTVTFGLEEVCLNINHDYDDDLDVSLVAPDGTTIVLISHCGGSGNNFTGTCLSPTGASSIVSGNAPFNGTYRPIGQLGNVNNGQTGNGTWKLHILDTYPFADQGSLLSWSVTFGNNPAIPVNFSSTNLPLIKIYTNGQTILNEPKITADMGIINNGPGIRNYVSDPFNDYYGKIGIELRGQSSLSFPQKCYGFETRDSAGNSVNVSLLGLPPENDWILYGPYTDKSLLRNVLTYKIANELGWYASRTVFCELLIDDDYKGIYVLMEKIKRDVNRVNIANLTPADSAGDALTGGYIIKVDKGNDGGWTSPYPPVQPNPGSNTIYIQYVFPKDFEITIPQQNYIQSYVDSMEDALASPAFANPATGYRKYTDVASFIDYFLINEISKNVDGYRLSTYFYKQRNSLGGKIHMGPVWDYNLAWHNADYCDAFNTSGWALDITNFCPTDVPTWFGRMMQDTAYNNQMRCRYNQLRTTVFDTSYLFTYIDSMAVYLDEAQQRHYTTWPILGAYVWPNPSPIPNTFQGEIDNLKLWISQRLIWMDSHVPGNCINTGLSDNAGQDMQLQVFPNPSSGIFNFYLTGFKGEVTIRLTDITGRTISEQQLNMHEAAERALDLTSLPKGVYILSAVADSHSCFQKLVIQ